MIEKPFPSLWRAFWCWLRYRHQPRHYKRTLKTLIIFKCERCGFEPSKFRPDFERDIQQP